MNNKDTWKDRLNNHKRYSTFRNGKEDVGILVGEHWEECSEGGKHRNLKLEFKDGKTFWFNEADCQYITIWR